LWLAARLLDRLRLPKVRWQRNNSRPLTVAQDLGYWQPSTEQAISWRPFG
jgi:hypothetical protein